MKQLKDKNNRDLRERHKDFTLFFCGVAPDNKKKYYKEIVIFYKTEIHISCSAFLENSFKDCIIYGKNTDNICEHLSDADEFFQNSSTFITILNNNKLSIFNVVSNEKYDLSGSYPTISKKMKLILRKMSIVLINKKLTIDDGLHVLSKYDSIERKTTDHLFVVKGDRTGVTNFKGEEILPCVFDWRDESGYYKRLDIIKNEAIGYIGGKKTQFSLKLTKLEIEQHIAKCLLRS